jgi:hypothetical protein
VEEARAPRDDTAVPLEVHGRNGRVVQSRPPQAARRRQLLLGADVAVGVGGVGRQAVQVRSPVKTSPAK